MTDPQAATVEKDAQWEDFLPQQGTPTQLAKRKKIEVYAAAYLPFKKGGKEIDFEGFGKVLEGIWDAGAVPVVNADTGFTFHALVKDRKTEILEWIHQHYPDKPYVAGVTTGMSDVFDATAYNEQIQIALNNGATEIMVMISPGLTKLTGDELIAAYAALILPEGVGILHELTDEFVPFGRKFTPYEYAGIMLLVGFGASKTSDLIGNSMPARMGILAALGLTGKRALSGVDYKVEEAYRLCNGVLMGAATLFPAVYILARKLLRDGIKDRKVMWKFTTLVRAMQSVATHQFLPHPAHYLEHGSFEVGCYRHRTAMYYFVQGVIASYDQPEGTEDRHLRPDSELEVVRANIIMLRKTLEEIGEDKELVQLVA